jgi:hypothetical protein
MGVNIDARSNTELGLLRSFIEFWATADSTGNGSIMSTTAVSSGGTATAATSGVITLRQAFVQFAGLTAGRAASFFDFYTGGTNSVLHSSNSDARVNLLAYTFAFGNGITASLSLEDSSTSDESPQLDVGARRGYSALAGARNTNAGYAGVKTTDVVANVAIAQAWGSAQLMGALHDDYGVTGGKLGYAIGAGVKVNLPMLAAGDQLAAQVVYGKGALGYVFGTTRATGVNWVDFNDDGLGNVTQSDAWTVSAGLTHNWTKTLGSTVMASYASYNDYAAVSTEDFKQIDAQANLVWKPVTNLAISGNVEYRYIDRDPAKGKDGGAYVGFLRVERTF